MDIEKEKKELSFLKEGTTPEDIRKKLIADNPFLSNRTNSDVLASREKDSVGSLTKDASGKTLSRPLPPKQRIPIPQMPIKKSGQRLSVNLVPQDTLTIVKRELPERLKYLALFIVTLCGLLMLVWVGISWARISTFTHIQNVKNELSVKEVELLRYKTQSSELIKLRERYKSVDSLLKDHVYWTRFFSLLEEHTLSDVYYTSFSVKSEPGARITLNARAKNVESVAKQLLVLQKASTFVDDVRVNGFSVLSNAERRGLVSEDDLVSFDITMTLREDVFLIP